MDWLGLEEPFKERPVPHPAMGRATFHYPSIAILLYRTSAAFASKTITLQKYLSLCHH